MLSVVGCLVTLVQAASLMIVVVVVAVIVVVVALSVVVVGKLFRIYALLLLFGRSRAAR